ncbi:hypothetical protein TNCV_3278921 [Trichonephila clavipes]|nr:hypothetical protein TNCV_3278921 [Trichonephila clavipes]
MGVYVTPLPLVQIGYFINDNTLKVNMIVTNAVCISADLSSFWTLGLEDLQAFLHWRIKLITRQSGEVQLIRAKRQMDKPALEAFTVLSFLKQNSS